MAEEAEGFVDRGGEDRMAACLSQRRADNQTDDGPMIVRPNNAVMAHTAIAGPSADVASSTNDSRSTTAALIRVP